MRTVVAERREAYAAELRRRHIPRLLLSDGTELEAVAGATERPDGAMTGSPASPGTVTGLARVVLDPVGAHLEPGEILVAPSTDPGWTPLFLTAGGLVMEMGARTVTAPWWLASTAFRPWSAYPMRPARSRPVNWSPSMARPGWSWSKLRRRSPPRRNPPLHPLTCTKLPPTPSNCRGRRRFNMVRDDRSGGELSEHPARRKPARRLRRSDRDRRPRPADRGRGRGRAAARSRSA